DETPANWKPPTLGTEIDDRRSFGPSRWEAPSQLSKVIRSVFQPPDHRGFVGRPDVLSWLQIRRSLRPSHRNACLAKRRDIIAVWNVVSEVVTHADLKCGLDNLLILDERSTVEGVMSEEVSALFEIMQTTRSMRRLKLDPVPPALIRKILEAGISAPSGGNMQRWRFLVIRDAEIKKTVGAYYKRAWDEVARPRYSQSDPA